ncbi:hypothetical protein [Murdochiella massiliensis]|uniref:hypothetical protein n=1 Tax=Murdochiella massiliensis TaxID=1673723 RepID=UPI0011DD887C|nr:hypothetical protein [Murdochiella massiliensis]
MRRSRRENRSFRREASPALEPVADLPDYAQQMAQGGNQLDAFSKLGDTHVEEALTSMGTMSPQWARHPKRWQTFPVGFLMRKKLGVQRRHEAKCGGFQRYHCGI